MTQCLADALPKSFIIWQTKVVFSCSPHSSSCTKHILYTSIFTQLNGICEKPSQFELWSLSSRYVKAHIRQSKKPTHTRSSFSRPRRWRRRLLLLWGWLLLGLFLLRRCCNLLCLRSQELHPLPLVVLPVQQLLVVYEFGTLCVDKFLAESFILHQLQHM